MLNLEDPTQICSSKKLFNYHNLQHKHAFMIDTSTNIYFMYIVD